MSNDNSAAVVLIGDIRLEADVDHRELSANVDGERVWFRFPLNIELEPTVEPFLPIALMEAMVRGVPICVEAPHAVSERLRTGLDEIQGIFTSWNSEDFRRVAVQAVFSDRAHCRPIVTSCYSGGIDSTYTYARHQKEVTHLVLIRGFDNVESDEEWLRTVAARRRFADQESKVLVPVVTNSRAYLERRRLSFDVAHGSLLAGVGLALNARKALIPSSFTYRNLFPWGSHPLLDPLWSTESTEVVHHGLDLSRVGKTEFIAREQRILDHLQVCWNSPQVNCGNCPKCVRTSLALHLLGKQSATLPPFRDEDQLRFLVPGNNVSLVFLEELILLCRRQGARSLERTLVGFRKRFLLKYHSAEIVKLFAGNLSRRIARRLWPRTWHGNRSKISETSPF